MPASTIDFVSSHVSSEPSVIFITSECFIKAPASNYIYLDMYMQQGTVAEPGPLQPSERLRPTPLRPYGSQRTILNMPVAPTKKDPECWWCIRGFVGTTVNFESPKPTHVTSSQTLCSGKGLGFRVYRVWGVGCRVYGV